MVSTELEKLSTCRIKLNINMPATEVSTIRKKQEKEVQKNAQIQGFRKGKAPAHLVKSVYAGTIEKNTLDERIPGVEIQNKRGEADLLP